MLVAVIAVILLLRFRPAVIASFEQRRGAVAPGLRLMSVMSELERQCLREISIFLDH